MWDTMKKRKLLNFKLLGIIVKAKIEGNALKS